METSDQPMLREISQEQLEEILEEHEKWIETKGRKGRRANLSRANLQGANLTEANLQEANLSEANLQGAKLSRANLQRVKLTEAKLQGAFLIDAILIGADLRRANLSEANLSEANLQGANLSRANVLGAYLDKTNLQKANLSRANLSSTNLNRANLKETNLTETNLQKVFLVDAILLRAYVRSTNLQEADLSRANLQKTFIEDVNFQKANLTETKLQELNLTETNLQSANLKEANLSRTNLSRANLQEAFLGDTVLREANLQNADLTNVTGLRGGQLAGTDVTGAKLPPDITEFEGLNIVAEASKNARKLFFGMVFGCVYSWLTIATTTDARLLTNSASSPLPIIGTAIPIAGFFIVAPLVLLCVYLYSHIYLQRLWEGFAKLPAVFPDGIELHKRAYPWLMTGLVCAHFRLLKPKRPELSKLQVFLSILLAWWVVPITILRFWARYLPRQDLKGTVLHVTLSVISIAAAIFLYWLSVSTLREANWKQFLRRGAFKNWRTYIRSAVLVGIGVIGVAFVLFSWGAIHRVPSHIRTSDATEMTKSSKWISQVSERIGIRIYADFSEVNVSEKPSNWSGKGNEDEIRQVNGARLKKRKLNFCIAEEAFLVNANLQGANLQDGNFQDTDLRGANLQDANLQDADLGGANLQYANLQDADFRGASLKNANLQDAFFGDVNLQEANLQDACLMRVDLHNADLRYTDLPGANLQGTDLRDTHNLTIDQLSEAETLYQALLPDNLMKQLEGEYPHLLEKPEDEEKEK